MPVERCAMKRYYTTRKTKQQLQGEQTKESLFKVALEEIKRQGYYSVTVDEICMKAGVSKGTFYVHYKSKEDIIRENYQNELNHFVLPKLEQYRKECPNANPIERLENYLTTYMHFAYNVGAELGMLSFQFLTASQTALGEEMARRVSIPVLRQIVIDGQESGVFTARLSCEQLMLHVDTFVVGIILLWNTNPERFDIIETGKALIPRFIFGLKD